MGIFDGFKKKKTANALSASKNEIIQTITMIKMSYNVDKDTARMLNEIKVAIESQPESKKPEIVRVDMEILELLARASEDISTEMFSNARIALYDAKKKTVERSKFCSLGGTLTANKQSGEDFLESLRKKFPLQDKGSVDSIKNEIIKENRELEECKKRFQYLQDRYDESNDQVILMEAEDVDAEITMHENNLKTLRNYQADLRDKHNIKEVINRGKEWKDEVDEAIADLRAIESEYEDHLEEQEHAEEERERRAEMLRRGARGSQQTSNVFERRGSGAAASAAPNVFERRGTAAAPNVFERRGTVAAPAQSTAYRTGVPGANPGQSAQAKKRDNERALDAITDAIDEINEQIQAAQIEQTNCSAKLRRLLEKRRTASPAECTKLDSDIIQLKRELSSVIHALEAYDQAKQNLEVELKIVKADQTYTDIDALNERLNKIMGNRDVKQRAIEVRNRTNQANETHSEFADAESVIDSVGVEKEEFEDFAMDAAPEKDDDKFADLERFLGMTN